jgi:hypothetical protein
MPARRPASPQPPGDHGARVKRSFTMSCHSTLSQLCAATALAVGLGGAANAAVWTSIGSAGAMDDADLAIADTVANAIQIKGAAAATLVARYNIVQLSGLSGNGNYRLRTLYRDAGATEQVRVTLYQVDNNNNLTTLGTFDSNSFGSSNAYQSTDVCIFGANLNFNNNAYYLYAQLTKGVGGDPSLGAMQLKKGC